MSRKTTATATKPARTRKAKPAAEQTPAPVEFTPKELELKAKYPHQDIIPQSYRTAGGREGWGTKHTVLIRCAHPAGCQNERTLATSDLQWRTTAFCPACSKLIKANHRATKAEKKKLK